MLALTSDCLNNLMTFYAYCAELIVTKGDAAYVSVAMTNGRLETGVYSSVAMPTTQHSYKAV